MASQEYILKQNPVTDAPADFKLKSSESQNQEASLAVNAFGKPMVFPLWLQIEGEEWWQLPFEPVITINGKNTIVKKRTSKGSVRGTIKERWCQDDYSINIEGVVISSDGQYPEDIVMTLRRHCEAAHLKVRCPVFEMFSIYRIVIEQFDFPMTTGSANQAFKINAVSDDIYKLLLKKEDLKKK